MSVRDLIVAPVYVKRGRLCFYHRALFDQQVQQLTDGWEMEVIVQRLYATRSLEQNAYWWGMCVQPVADHTGYSPEEIHEFAKQKFIPKIVALCDRNGEIKGECVIGGSTRLLSTKSFATFVDHFRQWAASELDVVIPDPEGPHA